MLLYFSLCGFCRMYCGCLLTFLIYINVTFSVQNNVIWFMRSKLQSLPLQTLHICSYYMNMIFLYMDNFYFSVYGQFLIFLCDNIFLSSTLFLIFIVFTAIIQSENNDGERSLSPTKPSSSSSSSSFSNPFSLNPFGDENDDENKNDHKFSDEKEKIAIDGKNTTIFSPSVSIPSVLYGFSIYPLRDKDSGHYSPEFSIAAAALVKFCSHHRLIVRYTTAIAFKLLFLQIAIWVLTMCSNYFHL